AGRQSRAAVLPPRPPGARPPMADTDQAVSPADGFRIRNMWTTQARLSRPLVGACLLAAIISFFAGSGRADAHSFTIVRGCVESTQNILRLERANAPCRSNERVLTWEAGAPELPRTLVYGCAARASGDLRR